MNIEKLEINGYYVYIDKDAEIKGDCYALHLGVFGETEIVMANGKCKLDKKIIAASPELNLEGMPTYVKLLSEKELFTKEDVRKAVELARKWEKMNIEQIIRRINL
jgi:hypothetical protein